MSAIKRNKKENKNFYKYLKKAKKNLERAIEDVAYSENLNSHIINPIQASIENIRRVKRCNIYKPNIDGEECVIYKDKRITIRRGQKVYSKTLKENLIVINIKESHEAMYSIIKAEVMYPTVYDKKTKVYKIGKVNIDDLEIGWRSLNNKETSLKGD